MAKGIFRSNSPDNTIVSLDGDKDIGESVLAHAHTRSPIYREMVVGRAQGGSGMQEGVNSLTVFHSSPYHGLDPVEVGVLPGGEFTYIHEEWQNGRLHSREQKSTVIKAGVLNRSLANWRDIRCPEGLISVGDENTEDTIVFAQGDFGFGAEARGPLVLAVKGPAEVLTSNALRPDMKGKVVVGGASLDLETLKRAIELGIAGLVVGGFDYKHIEVLLGRDGQGEWKCEDDLGLTLLATEGYSSAGHTEIASGTFDLLRRHEGREVSINGAAQVGAEVIAPRLIAVTEQNQPRSPEENFYFLPRALYAEYMHKSAVRNRRAFTDWTWEKVLDLAWSEHGFDHAPANQEKGFPYLGLPVTMSRLDQLIVNVERQYQAQLKAYERTEGSIDRLCASLGMLVSDSLVDTGESLWAKVGSLSAGYVRDNLMPSSQPRDFPKHMGYLSRFGNDYCWDADRSGFVHAWLIEMFIDALTSDPEDLCVIKVGYDRKKGIACHRDKKGYLYQLGSEVTYENRLEYVIERADFTRHPILDKKLVVRWISLYEAFPAVGAFFRDLSEDYYNYRSNCDSKIESHLEMITSGYHSHQETVINRLVDYNYKVFGADVMGMVKAISEELHEFPELLREKDCTIWGKDGTEVFTTRLAFIHRQVWSKLIPRLKMKDGISPLHFPRKTGPTDPTIWKILGLRLRTPPTEEYFGKMLQERLFRAHPCEGSKYSAAPLKDVEITPFHFSSGRILDVLNQFYADHYGLCIPGYIDNVLSASRETLSELFPPHLGWGNTANKLFKAASTWVNSKPHLKDAKLDEFLIHALPLPSVRSSTFSRRFLADSDLTQEDLEEMKTAHFQAYQDRCDRILEIRNLLNPIRIRSIRLLESVISASNYTSIEDLQDKLKLSAPSYRE